jgi:hypothetical protein
MLSNPELQYTLLIYAIIVVFYTFVVFCVPFNCKSAPVFCESYKKHTSAIIKTHAKFLLLLLVCMIFASFISPLLPNSMTDERFGVWRGRKSIGEIVCGLFAFTLILIERFVLFLEYDANDSDSENNPS